MLALVWALASALAGVPARAQSLPEALEAIERARVTTRILYVTAHPDDESSSVLTYLARGLGADVALLSITRGEGGQNALGPEQGPQLGLLRTEELLAACRVYGVRLYFTRAPDFGYSKTPEETLKLWGDTAHDDMVRVIRTFRPQIIINNWGGVRTGHGHHQAAGLLTAQAFEAAANPKTFPQQLAEGLKPWRAMLLLQLSRGDASGGNRLPLDDISPIWGKSYREIGLGGFSNHRTQGISAFLGSSFLRRGIALVATDSAKLDPADLARPLTALILPGLPDALLKEVDRSLVEAREHALRLDWPGAARALAQAGKFTVELGGQLAKRPADATADERWELERVRRGIDAALAEAIALRIEAQADRNELVAGESFLVRAEARGRAGVPGEISKPTLIVPAGWSVTKDETEAGSLIRFAVAVPKGAKAPASPSGWMFPEPLPLVEAHVGVVVDDYTFGFTVPVVARRATSTRVDTLPLTLVPAVTLALEPRQFVVAVKWPPKQLELLARVHYYGASAARVSVGIDAPAGWQVSAPALVEFSRPGDQLVRFVVTPPAKVAPGNYVLAAWGAREGENFRTSLEPLPSLPTRKWSEPAVAMVRAFDVAVPESLRVGYVAAENDPIPEALRQLGVQVELLDPVTLAFSDLRRLDAIAIGIRAYELREDLARANQRLLDYTAAGGTLAVQYQRENVWRSLRPAPYPAEIGAPTVRITDEDSPVRFLVAGHVAIDFPNKISEQDFRGWVQERGLYFWSQFDERYEPLLGLRDPDEDEVTGGLVYARVGKGVYIYTGLAFFRQLPEGVPGAYRLFINLLSQSRAPAQP